MNSQNANSIRQSLKLALFKGKKHQLQFNDNSQYHDLPSVTLSNDFEETYFYKHHVQGNLGEGAHGIVKICYKKQDSTHQPYAVKIFRTGDPEIINTIRKTFKINRSLNHLPWVIKAIDLFINVAKEQIHLVMELCPYPSLEYILQNKQLTIRQQQLLILELAKAVDAIHEKCVCHRDLKPDNILVSLYEDEVIVKIIDFGVSKTFRSKNRNLTENIEMWTRTGTLYYQAPEIFEGGGYNQKVDVWSLGIITYQLFCGHLPFQCDLISDTIEQICDPNQNVENQQLFQQLDILQQDLLKRLLKKDPERRLSSKELTLHPWLHPKLQQLPDINNLQLSDKDQKSLSTSEQLINLQQFDINNKLIKEPFCASTILEDRYISPSWNTLDNHIHFQLSCTQLNSLQMEPAVLSQSNEIVPVNQNCEDCSIIQTYQVVGSIIL